MAERPDFQKKQYAFAAHIRDPEHQPAPDGIDDRRMAIYRKLFFNNLRNLLGGMFPVIRKISGADRWDRLIRLFMQRHVAATPYFLQLPKEFLEFLQTEYEADDEDYPFLLELAHYEYAEIALSISEEEDDLSGVDPDGDLLAGAPVRSVLARVYAYTYPVHRVSADFLPDEPAEQPVFLAIYRRSDDKVRFLELNPVSAGLLDAIERNESQQTGEQLLRSLAAATGYPDVGAFVHHGADALRELRELEIVIGVRTPAREN
jgi:hypothetical protein